MEPKFVKIVVYVPVANAADVRKALAEAGAGHIGKYDFCSFSLRGVGRFRPGKQAKPYIGQEGEISEVEEERIETICAFEDRGKVVAAVKAAHPYEEPAIDVIPLLEVF